MTKPKWGGKRKGSGAKLKYGEPTVSLTIQIPETLHKYLLQDAAEYRVSLSEIAVGNLLKMYDLKLPGPKKSEGLMADLSQKIKKRSITIAGHRTSITIEDVFWNALRKIARDRGVSLAALIEEIDESRQTGLSSALRVFAMQELIKKTTPLT